MTDLTELDMADEDPIARAMQTPTFNKWSALAEISVLKYGSMCLKKGEDDAVTETKLIAQLCLATENSRKQAF
jgi:hypothetical protein